MTADFPALSKTCAEIAAGQVPDAAQSITSPDAVGRYGNGQGGEFRELGLFAGMGGLSEGLEDAGFSTPAAFCEIDPYCRQVLAERWPAVPSFEDVRTLRAEDVGPVDAITAGFPCQNISLAGDGAGLDGDRSGLWFEVPRLVREFERAYRRPVYLVLENVRALLVRGLERVLRDLAALGYDAEWGVVSACSLGLTHVRPRMLIVAYPNGLHGREGIWNSAARTEWALQAQHRFEGTRARQRARLANPSALYGGADGLRNGPERNRAIGNAVAPILGRTLGRAILEARRAA